MSTDDLARLVVALTRAGVPIDEHRFSFGHVDRLMREPVRMLVSARRARRAVPHASADLMQPGID